MTIRDQKRGPLTGFKRSDMVIKTQYFCRIPGNGIKRLISRQAVSDCGTGFVW